MRAIEKRGFALQPSARLFLWLQPLEEFVTKKLMSREGKLEKYHEVVDAYTKAHSGEALTRPVVNRLMHESGVL